MATGLIRAVGKIALKAGKKQVAKNKLSKVAKQKPKQKSMPDLLTQRQQIRKPGNYPIRKQHHAGVYTGKGGGGSRIPDNLMTRPAPGTRGTLGPKVDLYGTSGLKKVRRKGKGGKWKKVIIEVK